MAEYRTKTGRVLTDADIEALADEAERGYDVEQLQGKPNRRRQCPAMHPTWPGQQCDKREGHDGHHWTASSTRWE